MKLNEVRSFSLYTLGRGLRCVLLICLVSNEILVFCQNNLVNDWEIFKCYTINGGLPLEIIAAHIIIAPRFLLCISFHHIVISITFKFFYLFCLSYLYLNRLTCIFLNFNYFSSKY